MNSTTLRLIVFHLLLGQLFFAQEQGFKIPDSLKDKTYEEIYKKYQKTSRDTAKSLIYLYSHIEKGKRDNNKIEMSLAYWLLSGYQTDDDIKLKYLDNSIALSKGSTSKLFPTLAYFFKGGFYFDRWNYKEALNNYLPAMEHAKKTGNEDYVYMAKHNIALIKDKLGKYDEALEIFKECLVYEESKDINSHYDIMVYLTTLLGIAETYSKMKIPDSSSYYIKKAMPYAREKDETLYHQFVFFEGVNLYYKKNYIRAKDSIDKSLPILPLIDDKAYLVNGYFYMGKVNEALKKTDEANVFYKKIDSVFRITEKHITPEVRESYESLIKYYRSKKDIENQLVYVERLLKFDSILRTNNEVIGEKLIREYDTPQLLEEQENLIASINNKNTRYTNFIKILIGIVAVISILLYYQYQKRRLYRKRFEALISKEEKVVDDAKITDVDQQPGADIGISEEIIKAVLFEIEKFEKKLKFLKSNIALSNLALEFKTNSKYLSKIINASKQKNFTQYINDLRIDYAVEKLKNDIKFRRYTIKAIAVEMGFNTAEAFSNSFQKRTGLYPSYFIEQLDKQ